MATPYRPLTDMMLMARPKVAFYGAFPSGALRRMRDLLGVGADTPVLHVCAGKVKDYPFDGFGPNDRTLDLDPETKPDFHTDAREIGAEPGDLFPLGVTAGPGLIFEMHEAPYVRRVEKGNPPPENNLWPAVLIDRPYTEEDATHYLEGKGEDFLPNLTDLLRRCLTLVRPGGRVGVLDYFFPRPPRTGVRLVAACGVTVGYGNRIRGYFVYERLLKKDVPTEDGLPEGGAAEGEDEAPKPKRPRGKKATAAPVATPAAPPTPTPAARTAECSGEGSHAGLEAGPAAPVCVACGGTGKNSKGGPCLPCANRRAGADPADPRTVDELVASDETLSGEAASRVRAAINAERQKAVGEAMDI